MTHMPKQAVFMGLLVSFVGFSSAFAIVLQGLKAVGASDAQAASGLMAVSIAMGIAAIIASLRYKMPISIAWSTPGAALLMVSAQLDAGFSEAIGAFIICNILILIAGLWKFLGRLVSRIPSSLANAMLAGILLDLCLAPFRAFSDYPLYACLLVLVWIVVGRINKLFAVPAALGCFVLILVLGFDFTAEQSELLSASVLTPIEFVPPTFSVAGLFGIALPLFLVTMASQNIPGVAVLKVNGYEPPAGPLFILTGALSIFAAPF
ncbi:MAG: benzoate/H(+) symporter BenE family transporter, partial [Alphaproteobacteria bacterium]|nr:benzoate/H(+) symporter BenE family transporter [Alphaproteobacteria bacterium]